MLIQNRPVGLQIILKQAHVPQWVYINISRHSSEKQEKAGGVFLSSASGFICRVIRLFEFKFTQANVNQLEQIRKIPATQTMQMLSLFFCLSLQLFPRTKNRNEK
jgi:hypothetical protein